MNTNAQVIENDKPYFINEKGKKRYTRATVIDILFSVFLPFWGLFIGLLALGKGEKKRGGTMVLLGTVFLAFVSLLKISG